MKHYSLRISLTHCDITQCVALFDSVSTKYVYCVEKGKQEETPHTHVYLITNVKNDTLRTKIRKITMSARGNKLYSLKELSYEEAEGFAVEYLAYVMKEGKPEYVNIPEEWKKLASEYDDLVKTQMKEKKEKKKSAFQWCVDTMLTKSNGCPKGIFVNEEGKEQYWTKESVLDVVLSYYDTHDKPMNKVYIINLVQTLCYRYVNSYVYKYKSDILEKI